MTLAQRVRREPFTVHLLRRGETHEDGYTIGFREVAAGDLPQLPAIELDGLYYVIVSFDGREVARSEPERFTRGERVAVGFAGHAVVIVSWEALDASRADAPPAE